MINEFDFAPFYRSSIGFDRVLNLLNNSQRPQAVDAWPPYDIVKSGENDYLITMAVAGFAEADLDITQERNVLVVKGRKDDASEGEYLHRGIAGRSFERKFELADHVRVEQARRRMSKLAHPDHLIISKAVSQWYRHYNAAWDDDASSFLCDAAIELFNEGCHSADEMAANLIGKYIGIASTRVNAPSSDSVH